MNPSILFEVKPSKYIVVRIRPESLATYTKDAKSFSIQIKHLRTRTDMNPLILFQIKSSEYLKVRVTPESIAAYVTDAKAFNSLIGKLSDSVNHDVVGGGHKALPLDDNLRGRWLGASPVGAEHSTPPAQWCFSERLALALSLDTHPLMVIPAGGLKKKDITAAVAHVLGAGAVVGPIETHIERTILDEVLENLDSSGMCGGTC